MKSDKLHFIDYLSVGLLASLLFFTIFSSNYLAEKRVLNIRAQDEGGGDYGGYYDGESYSNDQLEQINSQNESYTESTNNTPSVTTENPSGGDGGGGDGGGGDGGGGLTPPSQLNAEGLERFNSMSREDQQAVVDAYNRGGRLTSDSPGISNATAGGLTPPSQLNADGLERFNRMSREDQQAVIDAYNRGGRLGQNIDPAVNGPAIPNATAGNSGSGGGTAGNSGTPRASNGTTPQNNFGSQLLNSLAQSLMRNVLSPSRSSSTGTTTSSTGTTSSSTGTTSNSTGTTSTSTGTTSSSTITPTPGTGVSNAAAPAESLNAVNGTTITFNMSLMFHGITKKPVDTLNKMKVKVILVDPRATTSKRSAMAYGDFVANNSGVWTGSITFTNVLLGDGYYLLVKGPKHLQKRICSPSDVVADIDGAGCNGTFALTQTSMTIDLSKNSLAVGDLPTQDSVANVKDLGVVKTAFGKVDWSSLNSYDLNLDGFINSLDYSLIIQTMLGNSNDQT